MKFSSVLNLAIISTSFAKKYLVETTNNIMFNFVEQSNIVDEINIGDLTIFVMEYEQFPYHLYTIYNYNIKNIEEDQEISLQNFEQINLLKENKVCLNLQEDPVWNLDRIDQQSNVLDNRYLYQSSSGENVNMFVVDTGIDVSHSGFSKVPEWGFNGADTVDTDCNGHGTHVAGTIGGKNYGVAKNVDLIAVKVLNCEGSGAFSGILKGLEYTINHHRKSRKTSVVNMSLGGSKSSFLNRAVGQLVKQGMHVVVAAGNSDQDACNFSPASEESVITVGATTEKNTLASFSNWGKCVDILAPGTNIKSLLPKGKTGSLQGTSMSSPHVAGLAALLLNKNPNLSPKDLMNSIKTTCTKNSISGSLNDSPNCLIYSLA